MEYKKTCVHCRKEFVSTARGQRFCSSECQQKHQKKVQHQREVTAKQGEVSKLVSRAYALSHAVAEMLLPKPDDWTKEGYRLHHKDQCVLNCAPSNLEWVKHQEHEKMHSHLPRVHTTEVLRVLLEHPELLQQANEIYNNMVMEPGVHPELVNKFDYSVVQKYRVTNFGNLDVDALFEDIDKLHTLFKTMGWKEFAQKVFHVKGKTALRACFKDRDYEDLFDAWMEEQNG